MRKSILWGRWDVVSPEPNYFGPSLTSLIVIYCLPFLINSFSSVWKEVGVWCFHFHMTDGWKLTRDLPKGHSCPRSSWYFPLHTQSWSGPSRNTCPVEYFGSPFYTGFPTHNALSIIGCPQQWAHGKYRHKVNQLCRLLLLSAIKGRQSVAIILQLAS